MEIGADRGPVRVVVTREVGDLGWIGLALLAHPDPEIAVPFDDRIGAHADTRRDTILAGNSDAGARCIEGEAVIAALDQAAFEHLALVQRRAAVAAAVFERDRCAV